MVHNNIYTRKHRHTKCPVDFKNALSVEFSVDFKNALRSEETLGYTAFQRVSYFLPCHPPHIGLPEGVVFFTMSSPTYWSTRGCGIFYHVIPHIGLPVTRGNQLKFYTLLVRIFFLEMIFVDIYCRVNSKHCVGNFRKRITFW